MTDKIKMIIAASCGAVGGAVVAFAATYVVTRKKSKKAVESALEAQKGLYEGYIARKKENAEEIQNEEPRKETAEREEPSDALMRKADVHRTDYSKIVDENQYGPGLEKSSSGGDYRAGPYPISEVQYSEERLTYDKVTCNYFEPDGVLLNEEEESYEPMDITRDVGWSNLEEFKKDEELEELYIRNDNQSTDYFIRRVRHHVEDVE